jgi:hypothetical protein
MGGAKRNPSFAPFNPARHVLWSSWLVCLFVLVSLAGSGGFRPFIETFPEGRIDWDNGFFYGTGKGYPHLNAGSKARALKVAQAGALSAILQVASGLRVDDARTLGDLEKEKSVIRIRALVRYEPFGEEFVQEGKEPFYRVTYRAPMKGVQGLTREILPHLRSGSAQGKDSARTGGSGQEDEEATWLVLDARGLGRGNTVRPALFPKIVSERGETLSDIDTVDESSVVQKGMARYVVTDRSKEELMAALGRVGPEGLARLFGPSPAFAEEKVERKRQAKYIVKDVAQVQGLKKTNLVISEADAREIKDEDASSRILKKCRVIVVVSGSAGGIEGWLPFHSIAESPVSGGPG